MNTTTEEDCSQINETELIKLLATENDQLKAGLLTIQNNLIESVDFSEATQDKYAGISANISELSLESHDISERGQDLRKMLEESLRSVKSMAASVSEISSLLSGINNIANQTNCSSRILT